MLLLMGCSSGVLTAPDPVQDAWFVMIDSHKSASPSRLYHRDGRGRRRQVLVTAPSTPPGRPSLTIVLERDVDQDGNDDVLVHETGPGLPPDNYWLVIAGEPETVLGPFADALDFIPDATPSASTTGVDQFQFRSRPPGPRSRRPSLENFQPVEEEVEPEDQGVLQDTWFRLLNGRIVEETVWHPPALLLDDSTTLPPSQ
ncbi:MAG: hypothetical protein V4850_05020 [Myxococcota bacterium]